MTSCLHYSLEVVTSLKTESVWDNRIRDLYFVTGYHTKSAYNYERHDSGSYGNDTFKTT